jgi:hypothetical protein
MPIKLDNKLYGFILIGLSLIILGIFALSRSNGLMNDAWFDVFIYPTMIVVGILIVASWMETKPGFNQLFSFNERTPFIKATPIKLLVGIALAIFFSLGAIQLGSAIIDLPQPFTQQALSIVSDWDKAYFQAIHPGFIEEVFIFFLIVQPLKYITVALFNIKKPMQMLLVYVFSSGIGGLVLTQAHRIAYGSDVGAYISIWAFETVVQFANLYTGMFISWIPHIGHNLVVSLNFLVAFNIGGVILVQTWLIRRRY